MHTILDNVDNNQQRNLNTLAVNCSLNLIDFHTAFNCKNKQNFDDDSFYFNARVDYFNLMAIWSSRFFLSFREKRFDELNASVLLRKLNLS